MKIVINVLASIFLILGLAFTILPMDTLALLPIGVAIALAAISYFLINKKKLKWEKYLLIVSGILVGVVLFKFYFIKNEVAVDKKFKEKRIEVQKQNIKDLEGLE